MAIHEIPIAQDVRSPQQIALDEQAAQGNWSGFRNETLLSPEGAMTIVLERKRLSEHPVASGILNQPFRWGKGVYTILRCQVSGPALLVEVVPPDETLVSEIKRRIEADRFHHLAYTQGFGFACFPEDYETFRNT